MPRIPTIDPESGAAVVNFPRVPLLPDDGAGAALGRATEKLGATIADIGNQIDAQEADLEAVKMVGQNDANAAAIKLAVMNDKVIADDAKEAEYKKQVGEMQAELRGTTKRNYVQRAFDAHVARTTPRAIIGIRADVLDYRIQKNVADIYEMGDTLAQQAGVADPTKRDQIIKVYHKILEDAEGRRHLKPIERQAQQRKFGVMVQEHNMAYVARTDFTKAHLMNINGDFDQVDSLKRMDIMEKARKEIETGEAQAAARTKEISAAAYRQWSGLANTGSLPRAWIEEAARNEHPHISPDQARTLNEKNENPLIGTGESTQVRAIMQEYSLGPSSFARIERARAAIKLLDESLAGGDPTIRKQHAGEIEKAGLKLAADERAEKGIANTALSNRIRSANDQVNDDPMWALLGPKLGAMLKMQNDIVQARVREAIRKNPGMPQADLEKIIKKEMEGPKSRADAVPKSRQNVIEAVKPR